MKIILKLIPFLLAFFFIILVAVKGWNFWWWGVAISFVFGAAGLFSSSSIYPRYLKKLGVVLLAAAFILVVATMIWYAFF